MQQTFLRSHGRLDALPYADQVLHARRGPVKNFRFTAPVTQRLALECFASGTERQGWSRLTQVTCGIGTLGKQELLIPAQR